MATFDLGRVTPLYKGDYSASASYELNDVVLYNGNLYWHVQATVTVGILPTDTTVWKLAFADEGVRAEIRGYADNAQNSADSALASKSAAATSASNASASASQAASSAQTAQTAETGATASAQSAASSAQIAKEQADISSAKAAEAFDNATYANQRASYANESASIAYEAKEAAISNAQIAVTKADEARSSATQAAASATSAQEYDESAQQNAVNAQTSATAAQGYSNAAAQSAESISASATQIAQNASDIADINGRLPYIENAVNNRVSNDELYDGYQNKVPTYEHGYINGSGVYTSDTNRYISGIYETATNAKVVNNSSKRVFVAYFREFTDFTNFTYGTYVTVNAGNELTLAKQYKYFAVQGDSTTTNISEFRGVYIVGDSELEYLSYENMKDVPGLLEVVDDLRNLQTDVAPTEIQVGKYTNTPVGRVVGIYSSNKLALGIFDVESNTTYVMQTQGRTWSTQYFAFADSFNVVLQWYEASVEANGDIVTMEVISPANAAKLYINSTDDSSGESAAQYISLKKKLIQQDLDNTGDLISADQMRLALSAQKTFTSTLTDNYADNRLPTFVHVADVHGDAVRFANAVGIAEAVNADAILNTGDSVRYNPTDDLSFIADAMANADFPMLPLVGNHESYTQTEQQMYTNVIQPFATGLALNTSVDYPTYYYRDFAEKNLRVIGVNQFQYRGVGNLTTQRHYHQEQIDFLCNALLSAPSGYGIIIMLHTPEAAPSKSAGYDKFYQEILYVNTGGSIKPIYEIVDAYISGIAIRKTYDNASGNTPASFEVDVDFSGKNNTEFICYVSGHIHSDAVYYITGVTNKQLMLNAVCTNCWSHKNSNGTEGSNYPYYCELSDLPRVSGTPTENAVNVYAIDRTRKTVKIVRIGSDMPYSLGQKRDYMTIPYADVN